MLSRNELRTFDFKQNHKANKQSSKYLQRFLPKKKNKPKQNQFIFQILEKTSITGKDNNNNNNTNSCWGETFIKKRNQRATAQIQSPYSSKQEGILVFQKYLSPHLSNVLKKQNNRNTTHSGNLRAKTYTNFKDFMCILCTLACKSETIYIQWWSSRQAFLHLVQISP